MDSIPTGHIVKTGYVPEHKIRLGDRRPMDPDAVKEVHRRLCRQAQSRAQEWPPPIGEWDADGTFCVHDGRHRVRAYQLHGYEFILVAWVERADLTPPPLPGAGRGAGGDVAGAGSAATPTPTPTPPSRTGKGTATRERCQGLGPLAENADDD